MGTMEVSTRLSSWIFLLMARIATVSTDWSVESATLPCQSTFEIRLISQTPRLGGMMISEVSDGKAKFYEGVQGRGRSVGA
jgi:hypothetical protein